MGRKKILMKSIIVVSAIFIFNGCAAAITGHNQSIEDFNKELLSGTCDYKNIDEKIKDDTVLWGEQGGSLLRNCKNYVKSNDFLEKVEATYKDDVDKDSIIGNFAESTVSVLVNNNLNDYEGNTYEKVMVNTYKALNYAALEDHANARVEFNRALDRQRRAKEYYEKEINVKKEALEKKVEEEDSQNQNQKFNTKKIANNNQTQDAIYSKYNSLLNDFEAYPDFINPFTTYVSGIYFLLNGDSAKANGLLKESLRMDPQNQQIKDDFELSKAFDVKGQQNYVWIIYENGLSMSKDEMNIHLPLFLFSNKVYYTGIALPKIKERTSSYPYLSINDVQTTIICNMDNVIKTEFKKKFPMIVSEAVINTIVKTYAQFELQKRTGPIGGIAGALFQGLTNKADVRSWTALPKNFQSLRVAVTGEPIIIKNNNNEIIGTIDLPKNKNALVYIKSQIQGDNKIHQTIF